MEEQEIQAEYLLNLKREEARSNRPNELPHKFWTNVRDHLSALEAEFRAEQAENPFGRHVMMLRDRVMRAMEAAEGLWTLRERKILNFSHAHAKDEQALADLTPEESELYQSIMAKLRQSRGLAFMGSQIGSSYQADLDGSPKPIAAPVAQPASKPKIAPVPLKSAAPAPDEEAPAFGPSDVEIGGVGDEADVDEDIHEFAAAEEVPMHDDAYPEPFEQEAPEPEPSDDVEIPLDDVPATPVHVPSDAGEGHTLIRAINDIPTFVGPDLQSYDLQSGDVANVPNSMADLLVRQGKAAYVGSSD